MNPKIFLFGKTVLTIILLGFLCKVQSQSPATLDFESSLQQSDSLLQLKKFDEALSLIEKIHINELTPQQKISYYLHLQSIYAPNNALNFDSVFHYINLVLSTTKSDSLITNQLMSLGNTNLYIGNSKDAYQNFLKVNSNIHLLPTEMDSVRLFSRLAYTAEPQNEKLKWLEKLNSLAQKSNNTKAKFIAYFDQINYYLKKEDSAKIGELLPSIKRAQNETNDSLLISNSSKLIAACYRVKELANFDSAEYYLVKAVNHIGSGMMAGEKHVLNLSLATTLYYKEEYQKAIKIGKEAVKFLELQGRGESGEVRHGYSTLAFSSEALGRYKEAQYYFSQELKLARIEEDSKNIMRALYGKIRIHMILGETEGLVDDYDEFVLLKDSINAEYNNKIVAESESKLGLALKEKEIEYRDIQLREQRSTQNLYLLLILVLAGLLAGAIWAYRQIRKNRTQIANQKKLVEKALIEKEYLLKEIHHRVKNNLQIISSLLDKQGRSSSDQNLKGKMQEGKNRIQSMALIHQNLYQSVNLSKIDFRKYILELSQNILATQEAPEQNIKINIQAEEISLSIDQAIPLGLILNELLTNSIKHGFKELKKGIVEINLKKLSDNKYNLYFSDDGHGLPQNFNHQQVDTLGLSLVNGLVMQLDGTMTFRENQGKTEFKIEFPSI